MLLGIIFRWIVPQRFGGGTQAKTVAIATIIAIFLAWLYSAGTFIFCFIGDSCTNYSPTVSYWFNWISLGQGTLSQFFNFGMLLDPLTVVMTTIVTSVSLLVQVYSLGYMKGDPGYTRYFTFMSLFTASMLGLVISSNLVQLFIFWELVGVSSYFLIGFWSNRPAAAAAAKKAFLMTRLGDFGFLLALMFLAGLGSGGEFLDINSLYAGLQANEISSLAATLLALGFFAAAVGKSAQFPLNNWLPDAMEGPTSVSALIHSATMVAAGVFLVARLFPLFQASDIMPLVALIGAFTAILAATMALVSKDIKRVLAFSTISQLGYMMLALGVGAYAPAIFHLFTHAFFKAGLFLASGSVHHATGTFNMEYMGGLRKKMPITYLGIVACGLSLAGIFPLAGFWSKDEILATASLNGEWFAYIALAVGIVVSLLTAFYMFRAIFITFHGKYRGGAEKEIEDLQAAGKEVPQGMGHTHLTESPRSMTIPIVILSVLAIVAGVLLNPPGLLFFSTELTSDNRIEHSDIGLSSSSGPPGYLLLATQYEEGVGVFDEEHEEIHGFNWPIAILSTLFSVTGLGIAFLFYARNRRGFLERFPQFTPASNLFLRRYYMDPLYEKYIVGKIFYEGVAKFSAWADVTWLDKVNINISRIADRSGQMLGQLQNGQTQTYAFAMAFGVGIIVLLVILLT